MSKTKRSIWLRAALVAWCAFAVVAASRSAEASCLPASIQAKLAEIKAKFGPVKIVSTHRRGARVAGSGRRSLHASCRAVDFHPPKGKYKEVVAWLRRTHDGGLGTYSCGLHHLHLDNGPKVRFHKCQGGSRYAGLSRKSRKYAAKARGQRYASRYGGRKYASRRVGRKYAARGWRGQSRHASRRASRRYASARASYRYAGRYSRRAYYY